MSTALTTSPPDSPALSPKGKATAFVRRHTWLWLILLAALALRLLVFRDLWIDELTALFQADTPSVQETLVRVPWMHPPLYHLILHYWVALFGTSEAVLRSLSIIVGVASIPALYAVGYRFFNQNVGLVAAALLAVSPYHIWYSQEVRMYVFVGFFAVLSIYFFLSLLEKRTGRALAGFLVSTLLAVYAHYTGGFLLAIEIMFGIYWWGFVHKEHPGAVDKAKSRKDLIAGVVAAAVVVLPLLLFFWTKAQGASLHPTTATFSFATAMGAVSEVLLGYHSLKALDSQAAIWPAFLYVIPMALLGFRRLGDPKTRFLALVVVCLGFGLALAGMGYPFFAPRFLMAGVPALMLIVALALVRPSGGVRRFFLPVVIGILLISFVDQTFSHTNHKRYGQVDAVRYVTSNLAPTDVVLHTPPFLDVMLSYYYPRRLPQPLGVPWSEPWYYQDYPDVGPVLFALTGKSDRVYLFYGFQKLDPRVPKPLNDVRRYLRTQYPYRRNVNFNNISVACFAKTAEGCPPAEKPKNELIWTRRLP